MLPKASASARQAAHDARAPPVTWPKAAETDGGDLSVYSRSCCAPSAYVCTDGARVTRADMACEVTRAAACPKGTEGLAMARPL